MHYCEHCGTIVSQSSTVCPRCNSERILASSDQAQDGFRREELTQIGKFTSAAEAGYFAHELWQVHQLPSCVLAHENFDAVSGYWSHEYLLAVPLELSEHAKGLLRELLDSSLNEDEWGSHSHSLDLLHSQSFHEVEPSESGGDDHIPLSFSLPPQTEMSTRTSRAERNWYADYPADSASDETRLVPWFPILITLTAGTFVTWGFQKIQQMQQPQRNDRERITALWKELGKSELPWKQHLPDGQSRTLLIDAEKKTVTLQQDFNGDGQIEQQETFELSH